MTARLGWMLLLVALASTGSHRLDAQAPAPKAALIERINQAFLNRARRELALNADQGPKVERVISQYAARRRDLERENRQLHNALNGQLRPGATPRPARVAQLVDLINTNEVTYAATFGDEMRDLSPVLSPVQRGQFQRLRDQFQQQVRNAQQARPAVNQPAGQGPKPPGTNGAPLRPGRRGGN